MIDVVKINRSNWKIFQKNIIDSEKEFPKGIRAKKKDYFNILKSKSCIILIALKNGKYVGTISGYKPTKLDMIEHRLSNFFDLNDFIYVYNFVINRHFRGKGFGKLLMKELSKNVLDKGYKNIVGHFRINNSLNIITKIGYVQVLGYENWDKCKEKYLLCSVNLSKKLITKI